MQYPEHITLLEGRGIVAAIRHKLRSSSEFGRHHLHLNDNMGAVLLCSKGRSGTFGMLRISRRIAALVLAADITFHCRWIPSEVNFSDKASRKWEHLRVSNAEGRAKPLCVVSTSTFRAEPRSSPSVKISTRSKTKRKMGLRCNSQKVRSSCTNQPGVSQLTSDCAATLSSEPTTPSPAGPKIFQPQATLKSSSRTIVIELFSGCARLSKAFANQGFQVYAYDIDYGQGCNLLDPLVTANLKKFIKKNASRIALVWMGTPCTTWSRARKLDGGPPPLRDDSALEGLPNLSTRDAAKILEGNQLRDISAEIALLCFMLHIAWVIENPFSSRIWLCESFAQLRTSGADLLRTDFCAYNTPWRKSSGFLVWNFPALKNICSICTCQQGRCSFSGRKHIILSGKDASGQWMTRRAQPYPNSMCEKIAIELNNSF